LSATATLRVGFNRRSWEPDDERNDKVFSSDAVGASISVRISEALRTPDQVQIRGTIDGTLVNPSGASVTMKGASFLLHAWRNPEK
jgi:hypothetical protein